jgi:hypothetical protein
MLRLKNELKLLVALGLGFGGVLSGNWAIAEELVTGPPVGTRMPTVHCYANSRPLNGRKFDAAQAIGHGSGAFLFIHHMSQNGMIVARALDELTAEYGILGFKSFTIYLSGDRASAEKRLRISKASLNLNNPIVVGLDGLDGPVNLDLNRKCSQSLLMIQNSRVIKSIALTDIGKQDRKLLRRLIEELTGPLPSDTEDYLDLVRKKLPTDPKAMRELVLKQGMELHRVNYELKKALKGIPKYRSRKPASRMTPLTVAPQRGNKKPLQSPDTSPSVKP